MDIAPLLEGLISTNQFKEIFYQNFFGGSYHHDFAGYVGGPFEENTDLGSVLEEGQSTLFSKKLIPALRSGAIIAKIREGEVDQESKKSDVQIKMWSDEDDAHLDLEINAGQFFWREQAWAQDREFFFEQDEAREWVQRLEEDASDNPVTSKAEVLKFAQSAIEARKKSNTDYGATREEAVNASIAACRAYRGLLIANGDAKFGSDALQSLSARLNEAVSESLDPARISLSPGQDQSPRTRGVEIYDSHIQSSLENQRRLSQLVDDVHVIRKSVELPQPQTDTGENKGKVDLAVGIYWKLFPDGHEAWDGAYRMTQERATEKVNERMHKEHGKSVSADALFRRIRQQGFRKPD